MMVGGLLDIFVGGRGGGRGQGVACTHPQGSGGLVHLLPRPGVRVCVQSPHVHTRTCSMTTCAHP